MSNKASDDDSGKTHWPHLVGGSSTDIVARHRDSAELCWRKLLRVRDFDIGFPQHGWSECGSQWRAGGEGLTQAESTQRYLFVPIRMWFRNKTA